ncbi:hypothetical protein [Bacillus smithii]
MQNEKQQERFLKEINRIHNELDQLFFKLEDNRLKLDKLPEAIKDLVKIRLIIRHIDSYSASLEVD